MTWDNIEQSGDPLGGWDYNENDIAYDDAVDGDTGADIHYNSLGLDATPWTFINKT